MDRRGFLKNLGFTGAAIVVAPLVSFAPTPKRKIYKVTAPAFQLWWKHINQNEWDTQIKVVYTMKGTLKEFCDRHPNDEIFYYQELTTELLKGHKFNYVRACAVEKRKNMEVTDSPFYKIEEI